MDQDVLAGMLVPGHTVLKGALWFAAAVASVVPASLLAISSLPTARLPLPDAAAFGLRSALFAASFMYLVYFATSQQIDREDVQGRFLMAGSRSLALSMFAATVQVAALMAAALAWLAPLRLPSFTPWCVAAYAAALVLAHVHQAFPATLWLWALGRRAQQQVAPTARRVLPPPLPEDGLPVQACRLYIAVVFWALYLHLSPLYVTDRFALSHATVAATAFSVALLHGAACGALRWRRARSKSAATASKKAS